MSDNTFPFGSKEWREYELSKPRREPTGGADSMDADGSRPKAHRRPKQANFIEMALELQQAKSQSAQADVTSVFVGIREPLVIFNIGGEGPHFKSVYRSLTHLLKNRRLLNRETILSLADGFTANELRAHLERQGGEEIFRLFMNEVSFCKVTTG